MSGSAIGGRTMGPASGALARVALAAATVTLASVALAGCGGTTGNPDSVSHGGPNAPGPARVATPPASGAEPTGAPGALGSSGPPASGASTDPVMGTTSPGVARLDDGRALAYGWLDRAVDNGGYYFLTSRRPSMTGPGSPYDPESPYEYKKRPPEGSQVVLVPRGVAADRLGQLRGTYVGVVGPLLAGQAFTSVSPKMYVDELRSPSAP